MEAELVSNAPVFMTVGNAVMVEGTLGPKHHNTMMAFPPSLTRMLVLGNRHDQPDAQIYPLADDPVSTNMLI